MMLSRAFPVALAFCALSLGPATAQFGGMPGMPGSPGSPGMAGSPFGAPQQPPPACQELITIRDEVGKHGSALQAASKKKVGPEQLCKLFKAFTGAETRMIKALEQRAATCGVPADVIAQVKEGHGKASEVAKRVCDAAAQVGARPAAPSLSEALGTTPTVPDTSSSKTKGAGTFDTLEGSPLAR
jgi:hypothetical protein